LYCFSCSFFLFHDLVVSCFSYNAFL
jgi:hypothetical protein